MNTTKITIRVTSVFMAFLMLATCLFGNLSIARAAEAEPRSEMTEEQVQAFFEAYTQEYGDDESLGNPVAAVLSYLAMKVVDKVVDKALDSAFDAIFGKNSDLSDQLNKIDGKLNIIIELLQYVLKQMTVREIRDSLTSKYNHSDLIYTQIHSTNDIFQDSIGKDNFKERRWAALQTWHRVQVCGASDSIIGMLRYCDLIANTTGTNWHGNYPAQYNEYARLVWDWDTQRIPFEEVERQRDIVQLAQMTVYNMLYLQYAQERGQEVNADSYRNQMKTALEKVIKVMTETPSEKPVAGYAKLTVGDKSMLVHKSVPNAEYKLVNIIDSRFNLEEHCWDPENDIVGTLKDIINSSGAPDSHLLTNAERDVLIKGAQSKGMSLKDYLNIGGINIKQHPNNNMITSFTQDKPQVLHFGDHHWNNWGRYYRYAYIENHSLSGSGYEKSNTTAFRVHLNDDDRCKEVTPNCGWKNAIYAHEDRYLAEFREKLFYPAIILVKESNAGDYPQVEEENENKPAQIEGIVEKLDKTTENSGQLTVKNNEGEAGTILYNENTELVGELKEGAQVSVNCTEENGIVTASKIEVTEPAPKPEEKTVQGTVTQTDDGNRAVKVTNSDGQEYSFLIDETTNLLGNLEVGAEVTVTYTENAGGNQAIKIEVTKPAPGPQPVPEPEPEPDPVPDPVPTPNPEPVPNPEHTLY